MVGVIIRFTLLLMCVLPFINMADAADARIKFKDGVPAYTHKPTTEIRTATDFHSVQIPDDEKHRLATKIRQRMNVPTRESERMAIHFWCQLRNLKFGYSVSRCLRVNGYGE